MAEQITPLQSFWNVFAVLAQDVRRCTNVLEDKRLTDPDEIRFWDRVLARSVFALIEGTVYRMAWLAYTYVHVYKEAPLSAVEIEELRNSYDFDEPIEPNLEISRSRLLNKTQWAFNLFALVHKADSFPLTELREWAFMKEILWLKQGLMYAREEEELIVYAENRETLIEGATWFIEQVAELLEKCRASMEAYEPSGEMEGDAGTADEKNFIM